MAATCAPIAGGDQKRELTMDEVPLERVAYCICRRRGDLEFWHRWRGWGPFEAANIFEDIDTAHRWRVDPESWVKKVYLTTTTYGS